LATDLLKVSLYLAMGLQIFQKVLVTHGRLARSFLESGKVFFILSETRPNGIIYELGKAAARMN
jgi:predicted DNA-binding transcriptional regulator